MMAGDYVEFNLPDENNYARLFYHEYRISAVFQIQSVGWDGYLPGTYCTETAIGFDHHNLSRTMALIILIMKLMCPTILEKP